MGLISKECTKGVHSFCLESCAHLTGSDQHTARKGRRPLRDQLDLLWELQKIDLDLRHIKEERERYPKEIKKLDEKKNIEKEKIQKEKEKVDLLEKERRQKEGHLNLEQEKVKRAEGRMFEVKTNKEYQALLNEIEAIKEASSRE